MPLFFLIFHSSNNLINISTFSSVISFDLTAADSFNLKTSNKLYSEKNLSNQPNSTKQSQNAQNNLESLSEIIFDDKSLNNREPQYPILSKRRGEEGSVFVRAFVDKNGVASKIEIAKSSSFSLLDKAALEAIKEWRFIPAKKMGQFVASSIIIPINFKLS